MSRLIFNSSRDSSIFNFAYMNSEAEYNVSTTFLDQILDYGGRFCYLLLLITREKAYTFIHIVFFIFY